MPSAFNILLHTPWWVFFLFALVTWSGIGALKPRILSLWRLLITPTVFIGWGLASLANWSVSSPIVLAVWLGVALLGAAFAWMTNGLHGVSVNRDKRQVSLPGSTLPLIRSLLFFFARYGLGVAVVMMPASRSDIALWNIAVSGLSAGYFFGWLARLTAIYRRATKPDLAAQISM
jgi:hypothetical protein